MFIMKKIVKLCFAIVFFSLSSFSSVFAESSDENVFKFKEGEHYRTIANNELSANQEMVEFFSFYCGHCFMFRSLWSEIQVNFPKVEFKKIPVGFLGGPNGVISQKAFGVVSTLGHEEEFSNELFNQTHKMRKTELSSESVADIYAYVGGDKAEFLKLFDSFMALSLVANFNQQTDKDEITGVPSIMVNNKYVILKADKDEMKELISYLLTKDNVPEKLEN